MEIPTLKSSHGEMDSHVILHCEYGRGQGDCYVRVKSPESNVLFILLHYAAFEMQNIAVLFDTVIGNKKRLINVTEIAQNYSQEHSTALMARYAYSGCASTSALKGFGKIKALKTRLNMPKFVPILSKLGDT